MRFRINLKDYIAVDVPHYITEATSGTIDYEKLADELVEFDKEIRWDEMWTIDEAKSRLLSGWRLLIFTPGDVIKGWFWLDNTNEPRNLYINKDYRGMEIGKEMHFALLNICKKLKMDRVECDINDWNESSQRCIKKAGWVEDI